MDFIKNFTDLFCPLSLDSLTKFKELMNFKELQKGTVLCDLNETPKNFFILKSGIVRAFIIDEKGKERTRTLFTPISTTGSLRSLILNKPSTSTYECLTDCEIYEANYLDFIALTEKHHEFAHFHIKILEKIFLVVEKRITELSTLDATARYLKLKNDIPDIDNLIQQYHIAAYLNITPVQLSRIRKEIYSK